MHDKCPRPDDPTELVGVGIPGGDMDEMVVGLLEEFIREGWDDEQLLQLFRNPFYRIPHRLYRLKGEAYIREVLAKLRAQWGYWEVQQPPEEASCCATGEQELIQLEGPSQNTAAPELIQLDVPPRR
ncbi:MAG: hypothetical protein KatS3mg131_1367 [Candidatus Tectimicrobiota bacterium]|nr:MAG: hypothetical protein KatS3mg131_1367 [Candidatus Tectomicrobia bacterium]